jgi:hypothetical protein
LLDLDLEVDVLFESSIYLVWCKLRKTLLEEMNA